MIAGVGIDLIEIERVYKACEREAFLNRIYTEEERAMIAKRPVISADNFAVKEAVAKALGTGFAGCRPCDIEVLRRESGAPYVVLHGDAKQLADARQIAAWHISISNTKTQSAAIAVAETADKGGGLD